VFAAVGNVAGKFPEAERELGAEVEESADYDEQGAEKEEEAAEFTGGIHEEESRSRRGEESKRSAQTRLNNVAALKLIC
jgi:hypothetical protein